MEVDNLSVVLHKINDIRLENTPVKSPGKGLVCGPNTDTATCDLGQEVQVRMGRVGICGTDIHFWKVGTIGALKVSCPYILGHETSGVINAVGEGVTNLQVGDRVAMEPVMTCQQCDKCKIGRYNLCPKLAICGIPPIDGGLTRYHVHDANLCFKLPDNVSLEEGALMEPLSVSINAARKAGVTLGSKVLICGAGTIGLLAVLACKAYGAAQVCIADLKPNRLSLAKELGADLTIEVKTKDPRELAAIVEQTMDGKPNITIEASGAPSCVQTAVYATDSGGCVMIVGLGPDDVTVPLVDAALREVDIRGINTYPNCYPIALAMLQTGKVNVKPLITHSFKMEQCLEAFDLVAKGEGIKVMIDCTEQQ